MNINGFGNRITEANQEEIATSGWPAALRSLRHREFRLFWIGMVISVMGTWMQAVAQGWLVLKLTNSPLYLGIVGACGTLPMLLFTLPAGVMADRFVKRNIILVTQTISMLQAFALAWLVYADKVQVWHVMALAACLGTANAFDMPTRQAMVLELVEREDALNAVSLNSSAFNAGRIIGPAIAGLLVAAAGVGGCFLINGISFLAIIVALFLIKPRPADHIPSGGMVQQIGIGMTWAKGHPVALSLLALTAVASLFAMPYATLMPVFARDVFRSGPEGYGFLMSASGAGALFSALMLTLQGDRWRTGKLVTLGSFIFPIGLIALGLAPRYALGVATLFITGVGLMLFNAVSNTMLQVAPPDALRGRVMSLRAFLFAGMSPVGSLEIGAVAQWLGPRVAVQMGAVFCLLAALGVYWRVPQVRQTV